MVFDGFQLLGCFHHVRYVFFHGRGFTVTPQPHLPDVAWICQVEACRVWSSAAAARSRQARKLQAAGFPFGLLLEPRPLKGMYVTNNYDFKFGIETKSSYRFFGAFNKSCFSSRGFNNRLNMSPRLNDVHQNGPKLRCMPVCHRRYGTNNWFLDN